jgi:hypothetical protein
MALDEVFLIAEIYIAELLARTTAYFCKHLQRT